MKGTFSNVRPCGRILVTLVWLATTVSWVIIVLAAFSIGFGTLPALYLLLTGQVQPGDLLPDDRVLTVAEYTRELAIEIAVIIGGFAAKELVRWLLNFCFKKTPSILAKQNMKTWSPAKRDEAERY